jgi:flavin reductase
MDVTEQFRLGMRRLASGVSIVATVDENGPKGFLATSVSSVAIEPRPCLLVCVNRSVSSHDALLRVGFFSVNLLAQNDAEVARRFSSPAYRDQRFDDDQWFPMPTGAPAYCDALANFDCEVATTMAVQTHTILIGRVESVQISGEKTEPLIYFNGSFNPLHVA